MLLVYINKIKAGSYYIRFRDNLKCILLGDVKVSTPISKINFAIIPTNTPFLLCLVDIDCYSIYLNNVDNVLVH
jgi:hypothetical protein